MTQPRSPTARPFIRLSTLLLLVALAGAVHAQPPPDAFDGSFRLDTGEVVNGGYMVEGGAGVYVYMDTEGLERGGVFERVGDTLLRSTPLLGEEVEVELVRGEDGGLDRMLWRQDGEEIAGRRVFPHRSREVAFTSADGTALAGRLLAPGCDGPHPAVVVVHGSGAVDRHGATFHTFFLQHGLAVLAYDKRGFTTDPDAWSEPDLAEMSADAAAAVRFAADQPEVDGDRVGLLGSSQGGWTAPPAAVASPAAFLVLRAGAAVSEAETNLHEVRQELRDEGLSGLELDHAIGLRREIYALAMAGAAKSATDPLVAPYLDTSWYNAAFGDEPVSESWSDRWWGWAGRNLAVSSIPAVERYAGPVLWFLGEADENVPLVPTRAALERAFAASPGDDQQVRVLADAPHSFVLSTPDGPRYSDGFFAPMAEWLAERGFTDPACWRDDRSPPG